LGRLEVGPQSLFILARFQTVEVGEGVGSDLLPGGVGEIPDEGAGEVEGICVLVFPEVLTVGV
jgi:hypothetical protein